MLGRLAYQAALTGEFDLALEALDAKPADEAARAWQNVLRLQLWFASDTEQPPPILRQGSSSGASEVADAIAAFLQQRIAIMSGRDPEPMHAGPEAQNPEARTWRALSAAWRSLCADQQSESMASLKRANDTAGVVELPELRIELAIAESMLASLQDDDVKMVEYARKASDAAKATHFPQSQYAANLALARARRRAGMPYLAARILSGLLKVAPAPWRPWLCWELLLSKGTVAEPAPGFSGVLAALNKSARDGDPEAWSHRATLAQEHVSGVAWLAADVRCYSDLIDAHRSPVQFDGDAARSWAMGDEDAVPRGLFGMCATPELASGLVVAAPKRAARRILACGAPLAAAAGASILGFDRRRARTDTLIAELLLKGATDENALFEKIYRFRYRPELHQNSRDVLYHRVRKRLGELATLKRSDGRVEIEIHVAFVIVDPRSSPPRDHYTVLEALASLGRGSIREVASKVGVSSRTVHDVLKVLADDGVCTSNMEGRQRVFQLEDTTYSDPTRSGRFRREPRP